MLDELLSGLLAVLAEVDAPREAQRGNGQIRVRTGFGSGRHFSHQAKR
jgi:hypothetical protein